MTGTLTRKTVDVLPCLPTHARTVAAVKGTWAIARVRPRAEKEVARDLADAGFGYFLPLLKRTDEWRRAFYLPLPTLERFVFCASEGETVPGYQIPTDLFYFLNDHPAVFQADQISAGAQRRFADDLAGIYSRVMDKPNYDDWVKPFIASDRLYVVKRGAFRGHKARVDKEGNRGRVLAVITTMGRPVELEIAVTDLEPAS